MAIEVITLLAYSDCVDAKTTHDETYVIKVSNENDFGGLVYNNNQTFEIRIHAKFYKRRFPEENESDGDSDGTVVKLSSETKSQKLLQVEPCPYHIHHILKLFLQHNTIFIDGEYWEKEESYEMSELNEHFTMESAAVWLTNKYNDTYTNVFGNINELVE